jgi:Na+(H+)/acetate symporter ActP
MDGGGLFGPTWDDVFRIAILVVAVVNVAVIVAGILVLRHYARLLLDVEQYAREARNYARERGAASSGPAPIP